MLVVSDLHCGSTIGLCPPEGIPLDDGGAYVPSDAQRWLWDRWEALLKRADAARKRGDRLHVVVNGDLIDGDHHGTLQLASRSISDQLDIAKASFEPVLALTPASVVVVRGTETHVGKSGSAEESFARWLDGQGVRVIRDEATGNFSHWHFRGEYGGVVIDATHHGRVGGRPWTKLNGTASLAAEIVLEYAKRGETPPAIALRSHYHQYVDTGDAYPTRVIQTPAFQLATAFVKKVAAESLADVGGVVLVIEDGHVEVQRVTFTPARTPVVRVA